MENDNIKHNAIFNVARSLFGILYPIITFPYATRILLAEGLGKVEFSNSIVQYFLMFAGLGISSYGAREVARVKDNTDELSKVIQELFFINLISMIVSYLIFFIVIFCVPNVVIYRKILIVSSSRILLTTIGMSWVYVGLEKYKIIAIRSMIFQVLGILFLFIFVKDAEDFIWYAIVCVVSTTGADLWNFISIRKYICIKKVKIHPLHHIKPIMFFWGMVVAALIYTSLDTTMLGFFTNDETVGLYTAANKMNRLVLTMITAAIGVLLPRIVNMLQHGFKEQSTLLIQRSINFIILLAVPSSIGLFIVADAVIHVFCGASYNGAINGMRILTPVIFVMSIASVLDNVYLIPYRKEKYIMISQIIGAVVNFTLNLLLIPRFALLGAIYATLIAESCVTLFQVYVSRKILLSRSVLITFVHSLLGGVIMFWVIYFLRRLILNDIIFLPFSIVLGAFIYLFVLFLVREPLVRMFFNRCRQF
ncbi:MAG: flippase [Treponema sp.]|nr:flippase [Treponema sp.]